MNTVVAATSPTTTTGARSVLDKPLHELTEDDIFQVTREDCRRYLKEKGMRRPSWNKSQAIQQVISLKSLLEPPPPSHPAPAIRSLRTTPLPSQPKPTAVSCNEIPTLHVTSNSSSSLKDLSPNPAEDPVSSSADDGASDVQGGSSGSDPPREVNSAEPTADHKAESFRDANAPNLLAGQMTIFYCGKVNVYNGVQADKAEAIMHLAASPVQFLHDELIVRSSVQRETQGHFPGPDVKVNVIPPSTTLSQPVQTGKKREFFQQYRQEGNMHLEVGVDGQTNRQVSLQRYLEKKKDRERSKMRKKIQTTSGLDMYLNQQLRIEVVSGQLSPGSMSSPIQPGQSRVHCSSMENQLKNADSAVDLNGKV